MLGFTIIRNISEIIFTKSVDIYEIHILCDQLHILLTPVVFTPRAVYIDQCIYKEINTNITPNIYIISLFLILNIYTSLLIIQEISQVRAKIITT